MALTLLTESCLVKNYLGSCSLSITLNPANSWQSRGGIFVDGRKKIAILWGAPVYQIGTVWMRIEALLLTRDFLLHRVVERTLQAFAIGLEHHTNGQQGLQRVADWKFSAVFADCDHDDGLSLLETTRLEARNRSAIVIAMTRPGMGMRVPFRCGANFVLEKPVNRERLSRLMRAGYGLMAREHFRYLRHRLEVPVTALFRTGQSLETRSRNVSTRGLSLQSSLLTGWPSSVRLRFKFSRDAALIESEGEVVWADSGGRAGIRLHTFPPASQHFFDSWIAGRNEFIARPVPPRSAAVAEGYPDAACS
jgi:CheY-like chemotaxis protein